MKTDPVILINVIKYISMDSSVVNNSFDKTPHALFYISDTSKRKMCLGRY